MNGDDCGCTREEVLAYVCDELEGEAAGEVAEHLADCPECREEAVEYRALRAVVRDCCCEEVIRWHAFDTPFGRMVVAATSEGIARVTWQTDPAELVAWLEERFPGMPVVRDPKGLEAAEREICEYFRGERSRFDLPVDLRSLRPFDRAVLEEARRISYGQVVPYAELARRIGRPKAARAVGNALGRNPVAIVVPCHRVVRSDGSLGGYGGGVHWKEKLLSLEGREDLLAS